MNIDPKTIQVKLFLEIFNFLILGNCIKKFEIILMSFSLKLLSDKDKEIILLSDESIF